MSFQKGSNLTGKSKPAQESLNNYCSLPDSSLNWIRIERRLSELETAV